MTTLTPYDLKMQRQNSAIDLTLLQDAQTKKDSKLYTERFVEVLEKAKAGDERAKQNLMAMRQKKAPFSAEDLLQLVISSAKNLDPTSENQQDFLGPIMTITNIFVNQENGEIQRQGNSTLENIQTILATTSLGSEKFFNTNRFFYDRNNIPQTILESNVKADGVYAEITKTDPKSMKDQVITSPTIGEIDVGKQDITEKIFNDFTRGVLSNGEYKIRFKNKYGSPIDMKTKIRQKLESYNFKSGTVETEGGMVRDISEIAN